MFRLVSASVTLLMSVCQYYLGDLCQREESVTIDVDSAPQILPRREGLLGERGL